MKVKNKKERKRYDCFWEWWRRLFIVDNKKSIAKGMDTW